jgi:chemotaxis protein methyltransferase CheR
MGGQDRDFKLLRQEIFKDTSLDLQQYKDNYLKRRIGIRMRARGIDTYSDYLHLLRSDPLEYQYLLKNISINVTHFFRDPEAFQIIEKEILPLMIYEKVKNNRRVIRLWCAGCSSGEEAYSYAILLKDLLGEEFNNFIVSVHGTDIDDRALAVAKKGRYLPRQIENVKHTFLKRFFTFDGERYQVSDEIKGMLHFKKQDLFSGEKSRHFDLISCRNVFIYFSKEMQSKLFSEFYKALNEGGYLVIGKTETLVGGAKDRFLTINSRERIFQKEKR